MKYRECYDWGCAALKNAGIEEAALDARYLLEHVCGTNRNYLLVHGDNEVTQEQEADYFQKIAVRAGRVPLQHITGVQNFMGLDFQVNEHVLIPRQDTEVLVETILKECPKGDRVLDMCTGSGCIAISLDKLGQYNQVFGSDISSKALLVAQQNNQNLSHQLKLLRRDKMVDMDLTQRLYLLFS